MSDYEDIDPTEIDADAAYVAAHGLDPEIAVQAWPKKAHFDWWSKYHRQMEANQQARQAA